MKVEIILVLVLAISASSFSVNAAFPKPVGFVNDFANILPNAAALDSELSAYEQNTTVEIAIVTIDSLPSDQTAFTYANEMFNEWGVGKKGEDNGILVLIVRNGTTGNRLRIELGYGIQGYITGAESGRILDAALPYYTNGDFGTTAQVIVEGLKQQLETYKPGVAAQSSTSDLIFNVLFGFLFSLPFLFIVGIIIVSIAMRNRCPYCIKGRVECKGDWCVCKRCGKRFKKRKRYAPVLAGAGAGGWGGGGGFGGGGGGGFGGGGSGGGGAGR